MNSYIPAIISLISTFFSYSQPIITSENFPVNSNAEIYTVSDDDLISLSPGNSGPNQIWDYSGVSLNEIFFFSLCCEEIAPVTSYYAQFFPDANYSISIYSIEGDNHTKFYTISSNLTECIGSYFLSVNTPINIPEITYLSNYNTFFEFPYSYNTMFNDTYQSENGNPSGTISNNYDSYGTLITPFATYQNVIRNKITQENYVNYVWYNSNPFFEIMNIQYGGIEGNLTINTCEIRKNITFLDVQENNENPFSIYPNPTSNILMIDVDQVQKDLSLKVYDIFGNTVIRDVNLSALSNKLGLGNLSNGIYFIEIKNKNQGIIHVGKIIKN